MRSRFKLPVGLESDPDFRGRIDDWVKNASAGLPLADDFLKQLPGVWPIEAVASLRRLEIQGAIPTKYCADIESALQKRRPSGNPSGELIATPRFLEHPLDFEWLFTRHGRDVLIKELRIECQNKKGPVLCLGCPSLFEQARLQLSDREFVLWDKNASSLGQIHEARALADIDLRHEQLPAIAAAAAVLDPPWYNEFYRLFIWAALRSVVDGGKILVSFPPDGTRPAAARDREEIVAFGKSAGATLTAHYRGCLPYRSPLFEVNALAAAGLHSVSLDWRHGDLLVFQKRGTIPVERPCVPALVNSWSEYRLGCVRVKIRADESDGSPRKLRPVAKNSVIPSVSTRFPRRSLANFVTTGNRFYHTTVSQQMSVFCQFLADPSASMNRGGSLQFPSSPLQLSRLVAREKREAAEYFAQIDGL